MLLKRGEFILELRRGDRARVQTEMVEFNASSFPFSEFELIWLFRVLVVQGRPRNVQKKG